ncbi:uncharacterized protein LOC123672178 [Harmonia axyridis]|uniref:uncharacterized protein LOC123672178 n=1 Tax=Harmonia axyridis TaxID=115357 RepID=UPI001E279C95|nr:uncharacterized protein LOC123672178 [Harmonia axyridis]
MLSYTVEIIQNKQFSICNCTYLFSQLRIYEVLKTEMETYSKIFLDENNHHRVKMEMGEADDSYEKGSTFDLDFQYTQSGSSQDNKNEIMDIVQHYTDENGMRSSLEYERGQFAFNQKSNVDGHIDAVHLNKSEHKCHLCEFAADQKNNLKMHIDSVHLNKKEHKCHLSNWKVYLKINMDSVDLNEKEYKCHCEYL